MRKRDGRFVGGGGVRGGGGYAKIVLLYGKGTREGGLVGRGGLSSKGRTRLRYINLSEEIK